MQGCGASECLQALQGEALSGNTRAGLTNELYQPRLCIRLREERRQSLTLLARVRRVMLSTAEDVDGACGRAACRRHSGLCETTCAGPAQAEAFSAVLSRGATRTATARVCWRWRQVSTSYLEANAERETGLLSLRRAPELRPEHTHTLSPLSDFSSFVWGLSAAVSTPSRECASGARSIFILKRSQTHSVHTRVRCGLVC